MGRRSGGVNNIFIGLSFSQKRREKREEISFYVLARMQFDIFRLRSFQGNYSNEKKEDEEGHFFIVIHNGSTAPAFIFFRSNELRRISAGDYGASDENGSTALLNLSFLLESLIEAVRKDYGASDQM